jgi:hypothetical protein
MHIGKGCGHLLVTGIYVQTIDCKLGFDRPIAEKKYTLSLKVMNEGVFLKGLEFYF